MTREVLNQYGYLLKEREDLCKRIDRLECQIDRIEQEGTVIDKVMGGEGGLQPFKIEGIPIPEYSKKKMWLNKNRAILKDREEKINNLLCDIESYISTVDDSIVRLIISYRVIENMDWNEVADNIGGGNTADSVKKMYYRYVDKVCPTCPDLK